MKKHGWRLKTLLITLAVITVIIAIIWKPVYTNVFLKTAYPQKYSSLVTEYSQKAGLDESLVYAVIRSESSFNKDALSSIGAIGLMQVTPPTLEWALNRTQEAGKYSSSDLYTPEVNIHYGTVILAMLISEFGDEKTAIAAYHAGQGNVKKWLANPDYSSDGKTLYHIPFSDTRAYVKKVEATKKIYADLYADKTNTSK